MQFRLGAQNLFLQFRKLQKMLDHDFCEEKYPESPSRVAYNFQNGYFGKPTKQRNLEPSMFEILTWNQQSNQVNSDHEPRRQCNCNCKCSKDCQTPQKERKYALNNGEPSSKKIQEQPSKKSDHKQKQQGRVINGKIQQDRSPKHSELKVQNRPKSAGVVPKSVKIMTSPAKLPKFIDQMMQKQQEQKVQQSHETKEKLIEKFKQTTRWIPNSSFTTYFGKPAFENYGRGNTNPTFGGLMYGNYLKTHNIQPHRGVNSPKNIQSYNVALTKGQQAGAIYPYPPKVGKKHPFVTGKAEGGELQRSQIYPEDNNLRSLPIHSPNLYDLQKFGGKGIQKISHPKLSRSHFQKQNQSNFDQNEKDQIKYGGIGSKKYVY